MGPGLSPCRIHSPNLNIQSRISRKTKENIKFGEFGNAFIYGIITSMKQYVLQLLQEVLEDWKSQGKIQGLPEFDVMVPDLDRGDYSTNAAMKLAAILKKNPNEIAAGLAGQVSARDKENQKAFADIAPAGGFVNFILDPGVAAENIGKIADGDVLGREATQTSKGKKVVFEYSSPNTNKPLHIGHVRNDVYGKACINLLKAVGYDVTTCEIINDRGTHIMKSVLMYMKHGNGQTPAEAGMKPDHFVGHFYKMFGNKPDGTEGGPDDPGMLEEAQALLKRWEDGDPEVREVWQKMNNWFFEGVKQTYGKEGTTFDEVDYESEIYDKGRDLVLAGLAKGVFQQEEDGSISVTFPEEHLGKKYLLRKDGTTIYITQDMYLWDLRAKKHNPDIAIVTTATEQSYHFEVLRRIFGLLEYPWADNFKHLPYEHVYLGRDKMSSRSGNSITSDELLESVKARVKETMASLERLKGSADDGKLVEEVAFGAIKYGYLRYEPQTRIYFDIDQTISLEGNTGPYVQYAHARIRSIMEKAGDLAPQDPAGLETKQETALMRLLTRYEGAVALAAEEYKPNLLCNYLYELASAFNTFYANVPVTQEEDLKIRAQRLCLIKAVAEVLKNGLGLLGIEAPERM